MTIETNLEKIPRTMVFGIQEAHRALNNSEFIPHFQPIVTLRTGQLAGFEVLARWKHPELGIVQPDQFIHLAEQGGWIDVLTEQVLGKALACGSLIPVSLTLAINISPVQLRDLTLARQIQTSAIAAGFALNRLLIEITESALIDNLERAQTIAAELKAMGCRIALDDFGTGYSSLLHLQSLPFDELKVDRSFVSSMTQKRDSRKIVAAVVGLGHGLGLTTVAEGIETQEQAEMMIWLGCELGQGWLYGRPVGSGELPAVISAPRQKIVAAASSPWNKDAGGNLEAMPAHQLALLQAVYDGAPVGLAFVDHNLRYMNLNQKLADMNGAPVEAHKGSSVADMTPNLFPQVEPYIRRALQGEVIRDVEAKEPESGATRLLSYQPARDEAGEVVGVSVAITDITERKKDEEALRESEQHYRNMVELNPQVLWIMDPQGRNLDLTPRWDKGTGLMKEKPADHGWLANLHPEDVEKTVGSIAASRRTGSPINVEYRVQQTEGGWRWMRSRGSPRFDAAGSIVCWYGSVEDIDTLKRTEEELRRTTERLHAVFAALPTQIDVLDIADSSSKEFVLFKVALDTKLPN